MLPLRELKVSFTLNPTNNRVVRVDLVLKDSVPHFPLKSEGIACRLSDTIEKTWNYKFNLIFHSLEVSNLQPVAYIVTHISAGGKTPAPRIAFKRETQAMLAMTEKCNKSINGPKTRVRNKIYYLSLSYHNSANQLKILFNSKICNI